MRSSLRLVVGILAIAGGAVAAVVTSGPRGEVADREGSPTPAATEMATSRADLERRSRDLEARLTENGSAGTVAAQLADVLLRRARVESNGGYTARAAHLLEQRLEREPNDYDALRALGAVRVSQHRFRQAIEVAGRARRMHPDDGWNLGILGDAHLELGEYQQAFDALDEMMRLRPDAGAYARVSYAHEIQGRLPEALLAMTMATEATSARDAESLSWHHAQLASLRLQIGDLKEAERELAHAEFVFPGHPYARQGRARLALARGELDEALRQYQAIVAVAPTAEAALATAELLVELGRQSEADRMFARAEALERDGWRLEVAQPANLARILTETGARLDEALQLAETAAASRSDIFTMDTLAWSYYRAGRYREAKAASLKARRTGTRDRRILDHAASIDRAIERRAVGF